MKTININKNNVKIQFVIDDENNVFYSYFGRNKNWLKESKLSKICQIETSEEDHCGCHCFKHLQSPFADTSKYVSHLEKNNNDNYEFIITLKNKFLENEIHYIFYDNVDGFSTYSIVKNISKKAANLEYISSFYLFGFGSETIPECKGFYLHKAYNSWHCEAQWRRTSFLDLGIFNGNDNFSMKSFKIFNTGSWSTKDYLPMCVIENENDCESLLGQVENNGSWNIEIGDLENKYYISFHGPEFTNNHFIRKLNPGDTFRTVQVSITLASDFEKTIQEITKLRRHLVRPSIDSKTMPAIFNDYMHALWDSQTEDTIIPLVDIAAEVGCEEFCMDAGWFGKIPWTNQIGKWVEDETNFPTMGLKGVCDYIRSKGMKPGIWIEIENMGLSCEYISKLPKEWFFVVKNNNAIRNTRYVLNFANPEVYKWAMDVVSNLIDKYGFEYLKNDYNVDAGIGNEFGADSLGDGLLKHNRAFICWLNDLLDKYPNLTIENCGSGGCRMDYEMLKVCSIQSTSDQTNYRKYPYLSSAVLTAALPEQAAVWSYPVNALEFKDQPVSDEIVAMNMVNAMLGRIHLASFINKLNKKQIELVKEGISFYKETRNFKKTSVPIYPNGISYFFDEEVVGGIESDKEGLLCVWNTSGKPRQIKVNLSKYNVKDIVIGYPKTLETNYSFDKKTGILIYESRDDYSGRCFKLIK